jgi:Co/Zn/Cd efflux system component
LQIGEVGASPERDGWNVSGDLGFHDARFAQPHESSRAVIEARSSDLVVPRRTATASIAAATLLMVLKLGTGLLTGSLGLVSAGIESSGDVVAATVTFFAVRLAARPADREHPYGHRRAENLSALAEAMILVAGGVVVVVEATDRLSSGGPPLAARWYESSCSRSSSTSAESLSR